ncbi:hypothetical protein GCM10009069_16550 [Algimonas arctica]|uniref:Uncharacterized protein n=1 Tax=Algimonas arctica TaxID=1479486 RepID=A0A8J3CQ99_9PROT|nr:hypothetical protein GCM10009069_16550 [Algimonas arctica]
MWNCVRMDGAVSVHAGAAVVNVGVATISRSVADETVSKWCKLNHANAKNPDDTQEL